MPGAWSFFPCLYEYPAQTQIKGFMPRWDRHQLKRITNTPSKWLPTWKRNYGTFLKSFLEDSFLTLSNEYEVTFFPPLKCRHLWISRKHLLLFSSSPAMFSIRSTWCGCFPKPGWVTHNHPLSFHKTHEKNRSVVPKHRQTHADSTHANTHALSEDVITWVSLLSVSSQTGEQQRKHGF